MDSPDASHCRIHGQATLANEDADQQYAAVIGALPDAFATPVNLSPLSRT